MTDDLWMILVLLGVIIVLAVVLYNWWQERKYRKDVEFSFSQSRHDVLDERAAAPASKTSPAPVAKPPLSEEMEGWMSEPRVRHAFKREPEFTVSEAGAAPVSVQEEPAFHLDTAPDARRDAAVPEIEATIAAAPVPTTPVIVDPLPAAVPPAPIADISVAPVSDTPASEDSQPAIALPATLNMTMDLIAVVDAPDGLPLSALEDWKAEMRSFPQQTQLWAYAVSSGWLDLRHPDTHLPLRIAQLACSMQLADRAGPVDVLTLSRFEKSVEALARKLGLPVAWQGDYAAEAQAQALDAFCIAVDKAVEFHVLATQGMFHATKLRGLAEACGLHLNAQGRYELLDADAQPVFTVRNYEGKDFSADMLKSAVMTGVTFQLDIPTTRHNVQVFDHMVEVARSLASSLNGVMMDVNRKPIGDAQLDKIRQQIKTISDLMGEQGIAPGSHYASRLFN